MARPLSREALGVGAFAGLVVAFCVSCLVLQSLNPLDPGISMQPAFMLGVVVSVVALGLAAWPRAPETVVLSAILTGVGAVSLLVMTGAWSAGPLTIAAGWDRYVMSALLLVSGLALPFALRLKAKRVAFAALNTLRLCLSYGALSQVVQIGLGGGFGRLLAADAGSLKLALLLVITIGWLALLLGNRVWLAALTASDRSVALARFLAPLMLLPIVGALTMGLAVRDGVFPRDLAPLLNAELSSVALAFVGVAALRGVWKERRRASTLAKAAELSPVMIHSEDGVIEYWPRGCENLFGYTAAEAIGRRAPDLLRTEYPIPLPDIEAIIRRAGEWVGEVGQTTRDGRRLWIATRILADRPEGNSELKLVETMADITELKFSNAALRDMSESFDQVVDGYELGMIDVRRATGQSRFSPQLERILGLEPGELGFDQTIWLGLVHPDDTVRIRALFALDEQRQAPGRTVTFKARHRDGRYRDLQGVIRNKYDAEGRLARLVGVYMDVTEILRDRADAAENAERLLDLRSELAHTSRLSAMGELAAGLAHELNQPLTAVGNSVGAIEMMLRAEDKPVDRPMRQRMLRAARHAEGQIVRAGEIIRRLREFIARGEADTQAENLAALLDDALALALPNPAAGGVSVMTSIPAAASMVLVDRIQIQQVLVNLIRNALESMRDIEGPGALAISAEVRGALVLMRVVDNGGGVASDNLATLFSPFVSTKSDGMGVGLSICRRIVQAHGGELWFEPSPGMGAEFRFTLPLAPGEGGVVAPRSRVTLVGTA